MGYLLLACPISIRAFLHSYTPPTLAAPTSGKTGKTSKTAPRTKLVAPVVNLLKQPCSRKSSKPTAFQTSLVSADESKEEKKTPATEAVAGLFGITQLDA